MHGRLKVKDPAVIVEAKRKEKREKQKKYCALTKMVLQNRCAHVHTMPALKLTEKLLLNNPDFYTAWNYRREIILSWQENERVELKKQIESEEYKSRTDQGVESEDNILIKNDGRMEGGQETADEGIANAEIANAMEKIKDLSMLEETGQVQSIAGLRVKELSLTQDCIRSNPKSYWCWTHRQWAVLLGSHLQVAHKHMKNSVDTNTSANIDWESELRLCTAFLRLDPRNFHCWDYRRWVVKMSGQCGYTFTDTEPNEQTPTYTLSTTSMTEAMIENRKHEIAFTAKKIEENFSNYSSWHYRSRLLPQLYDGGIEEKVLLNELDMVQSACFTEPDDQSAWLYLRWLLGQNTVTGKESESVKTALEEQLATCRELLELEPNSKWTLLTSIHLMLAIGVDDYYRECLEGLNRLCIIDVDRKFFYIDTQAVIVERHKQAVA
eukprot:CFRG7495T1